MVTAALIAISLAGQSLLLGSAVQRLAAGPPLAAIMTVHDIVPPWARSRAVTWGLEVTQLLVGAVGVTLVLLGLTDSSAFTVASLATAALYAGFTSYLVVLLARRGRVECGCLGGRDRANPASVWRAGLFAIAALAAPLRSTDGAVLMQWSTRIGVLLVAIMAAAVAVFVVPLVDALTGRHPSQPTDASH